jgi:hypothetical protein
MFRRIRSQMIMGRKNPKMKTTIISFFFFSRSLPISLFLSFSVFLFLYLSICLFVYVSVSLSLSLCFSISLFMSVSCANMSVSLPLSVNDTISLLVSLSWSLLVSLSLFLSRLLSPSRRKFVDSKSLSTLLELSSSFLLRYAGNSVYQCLCVWPTTKQCLALSVCLSLYLSIAVSLSIALSIYVSFCLLIWTIFRSRGFCVKWRICFNLVLNLVLTIDFYSPDPPIGAGAGETDSL